MTDRQPDCHSASRFAEYSTEQLKEILQAELISEDTDVALIKEVTTLLDEKTENSDCDVATAWKSFAQEHADSQPLYPEAVASAPPRITGPSKKVAVRLIRVAVIAAILLCILTFTAQALGYDLWGTVARWTEDIFTFEGTPSGKSTISQNRYAVELEELHTALIEYGITENILPTWLPGGYKPVEFSCIECDDSSTSFSLILENTETDSILSLHYDTQSNNSNGALYQKNSGDPEIYVVSDIPHYIMSNRERYLAVWINGTIECSMLGFTSQADLYHAINSIYEE